VTEPAAVLPARLAAVLARGTAGLFLTVGPGARPHAAFTWVAAAGPSELRIAVDAPSTSLSNLERNARAAVQIIAPDDVLFVVKGAAVFRGRHEVPPGLSMAVVEMAVEECRDQSWPAVRVSPLRYEWVDPRMREAEAAVLRLLRHGSGGSG
jgi:hypothetical protein